MRCSPALLAMFAGCFERPDVLVLCHNSNCAEPHEASRDDTVRAMQDSLALVAPDGVPLIDGIELDVFQHAGQCLFAHDAEHLEGHVELREAIQILATHLETHARVSHNSEQFTVKLELKDAVDRTDSAAHVTCALDAYETLRTTAIASGHRLEVIFDSYNPTLLREVAARRPPDETAIWPRLSLDVGVPPPLRADNYDLARLDLEIDLAEIQPTWITDTALRALRSHGVDFTVWTFDLTRETLQAIESVEPKYVNTGQAQTLRGWLDR